MSSDSLEKQLHQEFLNEFKQLLEKYDATFEVCDIGGCGEYYPNDVPCVQFSSQYDLKEDKLIRDYSQLELPGYINPNY